MALLANASSRLEGLNLPQMFDLDGTGLIDKVVLCNSLRRFDETVFTEAVIDAIVLEVNGTSEEFISIQELVVVFSSSLLHREQTAETERSEDDDFGKTDDEADQEANERAKIDRVRNAPRRVSYTADCISKEQVDDYTKPVYEKTEEAVERIREILKAHEKVQVLMGHMWGEPLMDVIKAFRKEEFAEGVNVIKQGDNGDCFHILDEGSVDIFVARPGPDGIVAEGDRGTKVCTWSAGALFGELALMYNAPRAATVTAACASTTWRLDALDFKMLLMKTGQAQYQKYEGWLSAVPILKSLNHFELAQIADIMENDLWDEEDIITQGEEGEKFFIIEDGSAAAFIDGEHGEVQVKEYTVAGEFFGEISLLTDEPRKATVRATGQGCCTVSLTKENFTNLLGPIADILKAHIDEYPQYLKFLG